MTQQIIKMMPILLATSSASGVIRRQANIGLLLAIRAVQGVHLNHINVVKLLDRRTSLVLVHIHLKVTEEFHH